MGTLNETLLQRTIDSLQLWQIYSRADKKSMSNSRPSREIGAILPRLVKDDYIAH